MGSEVGVTRFESDGVIMFFEYDGTVDVAISHLHPSIEALRDHWRNSATLHCTCGRDEPIQLYTCYGGGFSWIGKACRHCRAFTKGLLPYEDGVPRQRHTNGQCPEWAALSPLARTEK